MNRKKIVSGICALVITGSYVSGAFEPYEEEKEIIKVSAETDSSDDYLGFGARDEINIIKPIVNLTYAENSSGGLEVTGYVDTFGDVPVELEIVIPSSFIGQEVTGIAEKAFYGCTDIVSITVKDGIKIIGEGAFSGCSNLADITLPDSTEYIGKGAFSDCSSLKSINLPPDVTTISEGMFSYCTALETVNFPVDEKYMANPETEPPKSYVIEAGAFAGCESLVNINNFPGEVLRIGDAAFNGCSSLEKIYLGYVSSLGNNVFSGCRSLMTAELPGYMDSVPSGTFIACGLTEINIPRNVKTIKSNAFNSCISLENVTLPHGLEKIEDVAFADCRSLKELQIPATVTSIGTSSFMGCAEGFKITGYENSYAQSYAEENGIAFESLGKYIPSSFELDFENNDDGGVTITGYNGTVENIVLPSEILGSPVTAIGDYAFAKNTVLKSVEISEGVVKIGGGAFHSTNVENVVIPESVRTIGLQAFLDCEYLTEIIIPEGVTSVGEYAFGRCTGLETVSIPESLTEIGGRAFADTPWMSSKRSENPLVIVNGILIDGLSCDGSVTVPDGTRAVGASAFLNCSGVTEIILPEGLESIGDSAFYNCKALETVAVPASVNKIEDYAFSGAGMVTIKAEPDSYAAEYAYKHVIPVKLNIPAFGYEINADGGISITKYNLEDAEVVIPSEIDGYKVTEIGAEAFLNNSDITSVVLPDTLKSIGSYAFASCINLKKVIIPEGVVSAGEYAFDTCRELETIVIPESLTNIGMCAFSRTAWLAARRSEDSFVTVNGVLIDGLTCEGRIEIPYGTKYIGDGAFLDCRGITEITIPDTVEGIGTRAFAGGSGIETIHVPETIAYIGTKAFDLNCLLEINGSEYSYAAEYAEGNGLNYRLAKGMFEYEENSDGSVTITGYNGEDAEVVIPSEIDGKKVTEIGLRAFYECDFLTSAVIPDGVTKIGAYAFEGCSNLENIDIPESVKFFGAAAFWDTKWLAGKSQENPLVIVNNILVDGVEYKEAELQIPEGVTEICNSAFIDNTDITSVKIPEGVTRVGNAAFFGCDNLKNIRINGNDTEIDVYAFGYGFEFENDDIVSEYRISDIVITGSVDSKAYDYAVKNEILFEKDSGILGESVWYTIDESGVLTISGEGKITDFDTLNYSPFIPSGSIKNVIIEKGITGIGNFLFYGCSKIETVIIPSGIEIIGESAFSGCTSLKTVSVPASVKTIETGAFQNCTGLESVTLREGLEKLGGSTFAGCTKLESVTVPDSVTVIEESPFRGCTSLKEISLLDTIEMTDIPEGTAVVLRNPGENAGPAVSTRNPVLEIESNVEGAPGETVEVGVYIGNFSDGSFDTVCLRWQHDSGLIFNEITDDNFVYGDYDDFVQVLRTYYKPKTVASEKLKYITALYTIPEDAVPGTVYNLTWRDISEYSFYFANTTESEESLVCTFINGSVIVKEKEQEEIPDDQTEPDVSGEEADTEVSGDTDGNGTVNTLDYICMMESIITGILPDNMAEADMNKDNAVDAADLMLLRKKLLK